MSLYQIEVNDEEVKKQIQDILNNVFQQAMRQKYTGCLPTIKDAVKDLIYSHKDEIIDKVVSKAVAEIVRKGIPKLIERFAAEEN